MIRWIDDDSVKYAQATGDLSSLLASGVQFCMSPDRTYCVLIRDHGAWTVEGEGWLDANRPPEDAASGRAMMNFYKRQSGGDQGFWFKIFVPNAVKIHGIVGIDANSCEVATDSGQRRIAYDRLGHLMWEVLTGKPQPEKKIEASFAKLWTP